MEGVNFFEDPVRSNVRTRCLILATPAVVADPIGGRLSSLAEGEAHLRDLLRISNKKNYEMT
jgi:hypothetical protein